MDGIERAGRNAYPAVATTFHIQIRRLSRVYLNDGFQAAGLRGFAAPAGPAGIKIDVQPDGARHAILLYIRWINRVKVTANLDFY